MNTQRTNIRIAFAVAMLIALGLPALAQETQKAEYTYEEYSYYQKAQKETDLAKKELALFEFLEKFPDSKLLPTVMGEFQAYFNARIAKKEYDLAIATAKKLLEAKNEDDVALVALATAYFNKPDLPNYLLCAEILYNKHKGLDTAFFMAVVAATVGDAARLEKYSAIVNEKGDFLKKVDMNFRIFQTFQQKKDDAKATEFSQKVIDLFEKNEKPADFKGDWNVMLQQVLMPCYNYQGQALLRAKNYDKAVEIFGKILKNNPKDASSHFFQGMCFYLSGKGKLACEALARAVVLNVKPASDKASEQLKKILTSQNLGDDKYQELITKAKTELGIQ